MLVRSIRARRSSLVSGAATMAIVASSVPACAPAEAPAQADTSPLTGAWRLVAWESHASDGTVSYPYGGNGTGQIMYTADGRMGVHLMQRDREWPSTADDGVTAQNMSSAILGSFFAYYGRYSIDHENNVVTHHVEGALAPNWVGSERPRSFTFDGPDRVILSTEPDPNRGGGSIGMLTWERIAPQ